MKIIGAFVSVTYAEFGKMLDCTEMNFLGSTYITANMDTYDFLRYAENSLKVKVITEREARIIREIYDLSGKLNRNEISTIQLEKQYQKLYADFLMAVMFFL